MQLITTAQAALLLGCSVGRVRQLANSGRLPVATIVGGSMRLYERHVVERLAAERVEARAQRAGTAA